MMAQADRMPELNARMFRSPGRIELDRSLVMQCTKWRIQVWLDTVEFHCTLNDMIFYFEEFDDNQTALIKWWEDKDG